VIVADHGSVDGTREILEGLPVNLRDDREVGFWQPRKTTAMAMEALERGHEWVLPVDADEIWHGRYQEARIADFLATVEGMGVRARIFQHVWTAEDPEEANPIRRIGYRQPSPKKVKVACRLRADL